MPNQMKMGNIVLTWTGVPVAGPRGLRVAPQAQLGVDRPEEAALPRPRGDPVREVPGQRDEVQAAVRPH